MRDAVNFGMTQIRVHVEFGVSNSQQRPTRATCDEQVPKTGEMVI